MFYISFMVLVYLLLKLTSVILLLSKTFFILALVQTVGQLWKIIQTSRSGGVLVVTHVSNLKTNVTFPEFFLELVMRASFIQVVTTIKIYNVLRGGGATRIKLRDAVITGIKGLFLLLASVIIGLPIRVLNILKIIWQYKLVKIDLHFILYKLRFSTLEIEITVSEGGIYLCV